MSRFSPAAPNEIRAVLAVVLLALGLTVGGLLWARQAFGDKIRIFHARTDVQAISVAVGQYQQANSPALRGKLAPGANWRVLSREEYDWLITQLGPVLKLDDDGPDDCRTAGLADPWQRPYQVEVVLESGVMRVRVRSLGADGQPGTPDDIVAPDAAQPATAPATTTPAS